MSLRTWNGEKVLSAICEIMCEYKKNKKVTKVFFNNLCNRKCYFSFLFIPTLSIDIFGEKWITHFWSWNYNINRRRFKNFSSSIENLTNLALTNFHQLTTRTERPFEIEFSIWKFIKISVFYLYELNLYKILASSLTGGVKVAIV